MSLINCKECSTEFSDLANACPKCAAPTHYSIQENLANKEQYGSKKSSHVAPKEALQANAYALVVHMSYVWAWWHKYGDAIKAINPNIAAVHDHFSDGKFAANLVANNLKLKLPSSEKLINYEWDLTPAERMTRNHNTSND